MCAAKDVDRYGRTVALCTVAGVDLARWMVGNGHALDWPRYSKGPYAGDQATAEGKCRYVGRELYRAMDLSHLHQVRWEHSEVQRREMTCLG